MLRSFANRTWFALIILMCLCVGMQMLGLSLTMWNPSEDLDIAENWDFSIPATVLRLNQSILFTTLEISHPHLFTFLLFRAIFHPP
jgi:hypothetical protein